MAHLTAAGSAGAKDPVVATVHQSTPDVAGPAATALSRRLLTLTFVLRLVTLGLAILSLLATEATPAFLVAVLAMAAASVAALVNAEGMVRLLVRHPGLIMIDALVSGFLVVSFGPENPLVLVTLTSAFVVGLLLPLRVGGLILTVLVACYVLGRYANPGEAGFTSLVAVPLLYVSLYAIGDAFRRATAEQERIFALLARAERAEGSANERARLAREMHDSLAKTLHGIAIGASALPHWVARDPDRANEQALALAEGAERAASEARSILTRMRADQPDRPLAEILGNMCSEWSGRTGIACQFNAIHVADLSHDVRYEMTAVAGEALENVARHADASRVRMELAQGDGGVELRIADNGNGFDFDRAVAKHQHFGLQGMIERAKEVGGTLSIASRPADGTVVTMTVPGEKAA